MKKPINFNDFLKNISDTFIPVVDSNFKKEDYVPIDLSIDNPLLKSIDVSKSEDFEIYISKYLKSKKAKVAFGGYNETRGIYRRSGHFNQEDPELERNIHIGLDIWCDAGTTILAPLDGRVHSFKNNTNFGDYGPTIILEHTFDELTFFTLYGHLSLSSISNISVGAQVAKGSVIATLGESSINGDYAPHLHFQIIKDIKDWKGDYPGVSNRKEITTYLDNCPDPDLLLKIS